MATAYHSRQELIAERLADAISDKKLMSKDLAAHMGVKPSAVTAWTNGTAVEGWAKLAEICEFLGRSADELLGLKPIERTTFKGDGRPVPWRCPRCGAGLVTTLDEGSP